MCVTHSVKKRKKIRIELNSFDEFHTPEYYIKQLYARQLKKTDIKIVLPTYVNIANIKS